MIVDFGSLLLIYRIQNNFLFGEACILFRAVMFIILFLDFDSALLPDTSASPPF
jgi:hypothetical protein